MSGSGDHITWLIQGVLYSVKIIRQKILGRLEVLEEQGTGVIWWPADAKPENHVRFEPAIFLSFAFVILGLEEHVLPSLVLDDWGNEIKSLELYRWIREFGERFPRAELFGYGLDGEQRQHFLRDLELQAPFPCYAFATEDSPLAEALAVTDLLMTDPAESLLQQVDAPDEAEYPLCSAAVRWWSVPPGMRVLDLSERVKNAKSKSDVETR
jgi:hypothetical protein